MTKYQINKRLDKMQDCINEIRLGWQVDMNIEVLAAEADELLRKHKEQGRLI